MIYQCRTTLNRKCKNNIALTVVSFVLFFYSSLAEAVPINLALNTTRIGLSSPLNSDIGWGGGADTWDIVDGLHSYNSWANGLAFTGGRGNWAGQSAGIRQATIDFGSMQSFEQVVIWHHGYLHTPETAFLEYWNGSSWNPISFNRLYGTMFEAGTNSGYSTSDIYTFSSVTGSQVRYSFDNSQNNINGTQNEHGWIYEFEVFDERMYLVGVPEPSALGLMTMMVLVGVGIKGKNNNN